MKNLTKMPYNPNSFVELGNGKNRCSLITIMPRSVEFGIAPIQIKFSELREIYLAAKEELSEYNIKE